ncbi:hypothetical protein QE152_g26766 [Popillia japonica]|uniref:Uncharacterized protein n=1 Tax=Popillia japonica TaxID=7064 RepID=A0AAW1JXB5_POPJA
MLKVSREKPFPRIYVSDAKELTGPSSLPSFISTFDENYDKLIGAVFSSAKKHIPRGIAKSMFFLNKPFRSLDKARRDKWTNTVESLEFKKSSRKAQSFLRNPRDDNHAVHPTDIRPNKVASHIVSISRGKSIEQFTIKVKKQPRHLELTSPEESTFSYPFPKEEVNTAIEDIMSGKAPGLNGKESLKAPTRVSMKTLNLPLASRLLSYINFQSSPSTEKAPTRVSMKTLNLPLASRLLSYINFQSSPSTEL